MFIFIIIISPTIPPTIICILLTSSARGLKCPFLIFSLFPHFYALFLHFHFVLNASVLFNVTLCGGILSILSMFVILQRSEECNGECVKDGNQACNQMTFVCRCLYLQQSVKFTLFVSVIIHLCVRNI